MPIASKTTVDTKSVFTHSLIIILTIYDSFFCCVV